MDVSPDGCDTCTRHGTEICEIKGPNSKDEEANLRLCAGDQGFCLVNDGGTVMLDRSHAYFYQVQAQLHIVNVLYIYLWPARCEDRMRRTDVIIDGLLRRHHVFIS